MLSEYMDVFLEELEEQLQLMDEYILMMEQGGRSDEVVQNLFRAAHTLKGSSAAMGFDPIKQLTHQMEHLLDQVRSHKREVTPELIDLLFKSLDGLKVLKDEVSGLSGITSDISPYLNELEAFQAANPSSGGNLNYADQARAADRPELSLSDRLKIREHLEKGHKVYYLDFNISEECLILGARAYIIQSKLAEWGEVLQTFPDPETLEEGETHSFLITFLYAGTQEPEEIKDLTAKLVDVQEVQVEPVVWEEVGMTGTPGNNATNQASEESGQHAKSKVQTIRVSVERLDHLMNLVGELVIDQTRIQQVESIQRRRFQDDTVSELGHISDHLARIISDLQESVMKARMLPIEQLFNRFPRMVRDLARDLGKEVELVLKGQDTELDRTLIEEITDPLIHLIRNAIDHGLEAPDTREMSGKPRKGRLQIRAAHEDNQVVIYVEDDGAGINPGKMKENALRKGVITAEEADALSDREAIELIFRPGFSTAQAVSDVSGRGVGMDIVRSHIEKLNGLIDIETRLGSGTCFKIRLPLTLAIILGLLVKVGQQTLIIPMSNIAEIVRVAKQDIHHVHGQRVITLRNQVIPVVEIHDRFRAAPIRDDNAYIPLVIVGSAEKRLAVVVDELLGNQEVVIKSLGSYIGKVQGIAGATILGDGSVALILEISSLFQR